MLTDKRKRELEKNAAMFMDTDLKDIEPESFSGNLNEIPARKTDSRVPGQGSVLQNRVSYLPK